MGRQRGGREREREERRGRATAKGEGWFGVRSDEGGKGEKGKIVSVNLVEITVDDAPHLS